MENLADWRIALGAVVAGATFLIIASRLSKRGKQGGDLVVVPRTEDNLNVESPIASDKAQGVKWLTSSQLVMFVSIFLLTGAVLGVLFWSNDIRTRDAAELVRKEQIAKNKIVKEQEERPHPPVERMSMSKLYLDMGVAGIMARISVTITNDNDYAVKDVLFHCVFRGKSGTQLSEGSQTVYDIIGPKSSNRFIEVEFFPRNSSQISGVQCRLVRAERN
jgi:hypothetical protein